MIALYNMHVDPKGESRPKDGDVSQGRRVFDALRQMAQRAGDKR